MANIKSLVSPSADTGADKIFGSNWNDLVRSYQRALPYKAIVGISGTTVYANDNSGNQIDSGTAGTDDARVIQSALNNAAGLVRLSPNTFVLSTRLSMPSASALVGAGVGLTKLTSTGNHDMIANSNANNTFASSNSNLIISDLEIDATGNGNSVGILIQWVLGLTIERVYAHNTSNSVFELDCAKNVFISNSRASNAGGPSSGKGIALTGCEQFVVENCIGEANYGEGFDCESNGQAKLGHATCLNGALTNCISVGSTNAGGFIISDCDNVQLSNCVASNNNQSGFHVAGSLTMNPMLVNCKSKNNSQVGSNVASGFWLETHSTNGMLVNCIADGANHKYGFQIDAGVTNYDLIACKSFNHVTAEVVNNGTKCAYLGTGGNVSVGAAQLANAATDGFFYIPTTAGAPTGVPTAKSGLVPMVYDATNNQFYIYNGAWKKVTLA